jgi:hypothetical protein
MIVNATRKHELSGFKVEAINYYDTWSLLGAAIFATEYLHDNNCDDVRAVAVDDSWGYAEHWPFIDSDEANRWSNSDPSMQYIVRLVKKGLLVRLPNPYDTGDPELEPTWQYRHVHSRQSPLSDEICSPDFSQEGAVLDESWQPRTSLWYLDETSKVCISLNAFVDGDLDAVMLDGRGCSVAMYRMFQRNLPRHRVAVVHTDDPWPFETGSWEALSDYTDITMDMVRGLIKDTTLLIRRTVARMSCVEPIPIRLTGTSNLSKSEAERGGFEPPMTRRPYRISNPAHSTALPPLQGCGRTRPSGHAR